MYELKLYLYQELFWVTVILKNWFYFKATQKEKYKFYVSVDIAFTEIQ